MITHAFWPVARAIAGTATSTTASTAVLGPNTFFMRAA
jgi:hypothetical protein